MAQVIDATRDLKAEDFIIMFMGQSGSGRSFFIDLLTGEQGRRSGNSLTSVTRDIEATRIPFPRNPWGKRIVLVDTPGFSNSSMSDMAVLYIIGRWLKSLYQRRISLTAIVYLHGLTGNRPPREDHLSMLSELCGDGAMTMVALVTTMWEKVDYTSGQAEEKRLRNYFWRDLIQGGAHVDSLKRATFQDSWHVIERLVERQSGGGIHRVLLLQEELIDKGLKLNKTSASKSLYTDLQRQLSGQMESWRSIIVEAKELNDSQLLKDTMRTYSRLQRLFERTFEEAERTKPSLIKRSITFLIAKTRRKTQLVKAVAPNYIVGGIEATTVHREESGGASRRCRDLILRLVNDSTLCSSLVDLGDDEAQYMVDYLSHILQVDRHIEPRERRYIFNILSRLAKSAQTYPKSFELSNVDCDLSNPQESGGFGIICRGKMGGRPVCVKAIHIERENKSHSKRAQMKELVILGHLSHPTILPLCGTYLSSGISPRICIVSPWIENGDVEKYLSRFPNTPRIPLIWDIASGLDYLHDLEIIHADLKAKNVLVSSTGRALLADFGISHISMTTAQTTQDGAGSLNWMARELLSEDDVLPNQESDIWAFGCTCYEILTLKKPFYSLSSRTAIMAAIIRGHLPQRPLPPDDVGCAQLEAGIEKKIWGLVKRCWIFEPGQRPTARDAKKVITDLGFSDSRPMIDLGLESLMQKVKRYRQSCRGSAIDYRHILGILTRVKNGSQKV